MFFCGRLLTLLVFPKEISSRVMLVLKFVIVVVVAWLLVVAKRQLRRWRPLTANRLPSDENDDDEDDEGDNREASVRRQRRHTFFNEIIVTGKSVAGEAVSRQKELSYRCYHYSNEINSKTNMAICEVYSQTVTFKYKSTVCSKSAIFSVATSILSFLLPLIIGYRSHGFWLKNSEYREQPDIHFKYDYLMYMETDQPDHPVLCSTLPYTRKFDRCSVVKSREEDNNLDGKFDELIFEISVDVPENVGVYSIQLILIFDYVIQKKCLLQMESLGLIQYSSGLPGFKFNFIGDLRLVQKQLLTTRGRDFRYNQPIFSTDEKFNSDLNLNEILMNYAKRNISTKLENVYQAWASGILLDEPFTVKVNVNYPEENIMYKPSFWQVMKWAWIQYLSLLFIFLNIFQKIKSYVFRNHIVPTIKEVPWDKKIM